MKNEAVLKFDKYQVELFDFRLNAKHQKKEKEIADVHFDFKHKQIESNKFEIKITVWLNDSGFCNNTKEFYLKVIVVGYFTFIGDNPKNKTHVRMTKICTSAILFPYIRSLISHITLEAQIDPVLLPTLNINKQFEENK